MAQTDLISPNTFSGLVDARLVSAGSETSFVDGGWGKSRFGKARDGARLAEAALTWNPQFTGNVSAVVSGEHQDGQRRWFDVGEAYLRYRSNPQGALRIAARAGVFYPDISLEHDGLDWSVPDTITPSAINSWVGEEVKVEGAEATLRGVLFGQDLALTVAGFVGDDLRAACLACLDLDPGKVRAYAERFSWRAAAEEFIVNLQPYPEPEKTKFWRRLRRLARLRRRPKAKPPFGPAAG